MKMARLKFMVGFIGLLTGYQKEKDKLYMYYGGKGTIRYHG